MPLLRIAVCSLSILMLMAPRVVEAHGGLIDTIAPASGKAGDRITISGNGFGSHNVRITVGGVRATLVSANGHKVTFVVPAGLRPGPTMVTAANPGGRSDSIAFRIQGGSSGSGLPQIVSAQTSRTSSATITEAGGIVTATATDGTIYSLSVPPGAVLSDTLVTITPASTANLPFSGTSFAVRLQPSGLHLFRPAILEISSPGASSARIQTGSTGTASRRQRHAFRSHLVRWRMFLRWLRETHHQHQPPPPPPDDPDVPTDRTLGFIFDDAGTNFEVLPVVSDGTSMAIEVAHFSGAGTAGVTPADFAASMQPLIAALPNTLPPTQVASLLSSLVSWLEPPPGAAPGFDLCAATTICQQVFQLATQSLVLHRDQACSQAQAFVLAGEPFLARDSLGHVMRIGVRLVELGNLAREANVAGFEQTLDFTCIADSLNSIVDLTRDQILDNPRGGLLALLFDLAADAELLELTEQQLHALTTLNSVLNTLVDRARDQCLTDPTVGEFLIDLILDVFPLTHLDGIDPGLGIRISEVFAGCRVRISPPLATVGIGQTVQFTGSTLGLTPADVTWSVTGGGSITQSGLFTAGQGTGTSTVVATSVAEPARSKRARVTVVNVSVTVSPSSVTLLPGATRQFTVFLSGLSNVDVVWTATRGSIDPLTGFFTAPTTLGPLTVRATSVAAPLAFGEATVTIAPASNGSITSISHVTFIGACASADLQVFTQGFINPAMTFTVQGDGVLRNQTLIGSTTFTTWRAGNGATGQLVITATSVESPSVTGSATFRVDPFVAAYGGGSSGSAFIVRGIDAGLPDASYRIAVVPGINFNVSQTFIATASGGTLSGTAANGDSISVVIGSEMQGTVTIAGATRTIQLSHNCAPSN